MTKSKKRQSQKKTNPSIKKLKPPKTLKEAIQFELNKETSIKDAQGKTKKVRKLEALASSIVADAIANDGATRRLLLRSDMLNLPSKEQELELPPDEEKMMTVEKECGELLKSFASADPKIRNVLAALITDITNEKFREGENDEH